MGFRIATWNVWGAGDPWRYTEEGYGHMETGASITAHRFYLRMGYFDVRETETEFGVNHIMRKALQV